MPRRHHPRIPVQPSLPEVDLDHVAHTSKARWSAAAEDEAPPSYMRSESVSPPFHVVPTESYVKKSEVGLAWKVATIAGAIFLAAGVPIIWFAASLNSTVQNVVSDVGEMKTKTEGLAEQNMRRDERLTAVEHSIDAVRKLVRDSPERKSGRETPK